MSSAVEIKPITRVEGHGRITVSLDGGKVSRVSLSLFESPRFFESLLTGKSHVEVPEIICRICSLCSTVHRICALQAIEKSMNAPTSEQTRLFRELILYGGHIQSHAMHLFCLVLPDCFRVAGLSGLADKAPEELKMGLRIKRVGNLIQETVGGRLIHPVTLIPGGMGKPVNREGLLMLKEALQSALPEAHAALRLFAALPQAGGGVLPAPRYLALKPDTVPFFGEGLVMGNGRRIPADSYRTALSERLPESGNAKTVLIDGEAPTVGALARLNLGLRLSTTAAAAFSEFRPVLSGGDIRANNLAQALELILAVERSLEVVDTLLEAGFSREEPATFAIGRGQGSAAIEAPRGVLIHSYGFDSRGICTEADVITPTAINQAAMERDLLALACQMEGADGRELTASLEQLVRAYDPCISCAVHLVRL